MAQFIKVNQKDGVEILINTNIIETIFPDSTFPNCNSLINFNRASAKKVLIPNKLWKKFGK